MIVTVPKSWQMRTDTTTLHVIGCVLKATVSVNGKKPECVSE
jgi:hypothetical protein